MATVLDLLLSSLVAGLSYNTLKVQVSALSALMDTLLSRESLVICFLRAAIKILLPKWIFSIGLKRVTEETLLPICRKFVMES